MIKDFNQFKRADKKGYIIVPRRLLETMFFGKTDAARAEAQMYVYFLFMACYADMDRAGENGTESLERGSLFYTVSELCTRFGLNYRTVQRFLLRLEAEGVVKLTAVDGARMSRMKLLYYDNLCRFTDRTPGGCVRTKKADLEFIAFWDSYHYMTGLPELEIDEARAHWNRLTAQERKLAADNVAAYVCTQRFDRLRTASNYLAHKSFYL